VNKSSTDKMHHHI